MKKKLLFGMMAALTLAASCQNDFDYVPNGEETAQVTFNVGAPEIATRAFSDGTTATVLQYAVYNAEGNELTDLTVTNGEIHGSTTVNLQLTTGNTYSVIFWAAAENAPYTVDFAAKTMTVDYTNAVSNDEERDAFYAYHEFTVTGSQTETVYLKRPFAQLNIGTSDYDAAEAAGYAPAYSYVKVPVSAELNLVDGSVDAAAEVEFKLASIPANEEFPVAGYDYLSMNYLLVAAEKEVVDIEFGYSENNTTVEKSRIVGSVPVQRNHRTNIYGQLLTSDVDVNIEIKPGYDDDEYNKELPAIVAVSTAEEFNEALADPDVYEIVLNGDITLDGGLTFGAAASTYSTRAAATIHGRDIVIDGNGKTIKITAYGTGRMIDFTKETNGANLTLKNLTLLNGVSWIERGVNYNTSGTLTLENVTIKSAEGCSMNYAVNLPSSSADAKVEIKNSEIWATANALNIWGKNVVANVTDSKLYVIDNNDEEGYSVISLNNDGNNSAEGSVVTVTGGEVKVTGTATADSHATKNSTLTGNITIDETTEVVGDHNSNKAIVVYEGADSFYGFSSLQDAINKVQKDNAGSVRLIRDLVIDKTITVANDDYQVVLDMNGCKLSYAVSNGGKASAVFVVNPQADFKIVNSGQNESEISFVAADPDLAAIPAYATNTITNEGTLYIGAGVTVKNESNGGASYAVDDKGKFTLDGGKLLGNRCALRIAKYNQDDVQFTMQSGTVKALTPAWIQLPGSNASAAPKITVTIEGGLMQSTKENADEANVMYTYSYGNSHANTTITINGGEFLGGTVSIGSGYKGDAPTLTINGGTFDHDVIQWLENDESKVLYQANK